MTTAPTCPFCLREMRHFSSTFDEVYYGDLTCPCPIGSHVFPIDEKHLNQLTAAVMEMRKRDFAAGLQYHTGPLNYTAWVNDNFDNYINGLKAEAKK